MPASQPRDLDAAVDALYLRPLDEFIAARDAVVRQAVDSGDQLGAERIKRLPKPSVAAWVINRVVREHPEEIAALVQLGDELRAATTDRDRDRLRALDQLRRERIDMLVRSVREGGRARAVSSAVLDRLAETLTAAVMDPDAGSAVRAGRLARALQHVGFGIVDEQGGEADLVALRPGPGPGEPGEPAGSVGSVRAAGAEEAAASAASAAEQVAADEVAAERAAAERAVEEASARVDRLEERRDVLRERLRSADEELERGESAVARLDCELVRLAAERDAVRGGLDDARAAADEVRAGLVRVEDDLDEAVAHAAGARRRRREARGAIGRGR